MKIYFEDGDLRDYTSKYTGILETVGWSLNASHGVTENIEVLDYLLREKPNTVVYTNSIFAFHNMYAWNEALKAPEIFIRAGEAGTWVRIDKLTNRELKEGHNLAKMYVAGEFENKMAIYNEDVS
jgi:hypothetical protein